MKTPLVIFDFDGTICDSYQLFISTLNQISGDYRFRKVESNEMDKLRDLSSREILAEIGISSLKLPFVVRRMRKEIYGKIMETQLVPEMDTVLKQIRAFIPSMGILTSNALENVDSFLRAHELNIFNFVFTGSSVFGKDRLLKKIIRKSKISHQKDQILYIGDETRDVEAARKVGIKYIAVSWGFNSKNALKKMDLPFMANHPAELLEKIREELCAE